MTAPTNPALRYVRAHANEYRRCVQIVGCTVPYPDDNHCTRCEQVSQRPLVPYRNGWLCKGCAYPAHD